MTSYLKNSQLPCFCGNCGIKNLCYENNLDDIKYYLNYFDSNKKNMKEYDYMVRMEVLGRSYKLLTEPKIEDDVENDAEEILIEEVVVTRNNTKKLWTKYDPNGDFKHIYLGSMVYVTNQLFDGNKHMVYPSNLVEGEPHPHIGMFSHIYYDENDNQFKKEIDWVLAHDQGGWWRYWSSAHIE